MKALRKAAGLNQERFSKELGVARSLVARCEAGEKHPSNDMCIRLGKFASRKRDYRGALWFWERAGLNLGAILPVAVHSLKELRAPIRYGDIVRIPASRIPYGQETKRALRPFPVTSSIVTNPESTTYVRVTGDQLRPLFGPGDILIIDESRKDLWALEGEWVALYRHTRRLYLQDSEVKGLNDAEVTRHLARYRFDRIGLMVGWLARRPRPEIVSLVLEAPDEKGGMTSELVAFEIEKSAAKRGRSRRVSMPEIGTLGHVISWVSADRARS